MRREAPVTTAIFPVSFGSTRDLLGGIRTQQCIRTDRIVLHDLHVNPQPYLVMLEIRVRIVGNTRHLGEQVDPAQFDNVYVVLEPGDLRWNFGSPCCRATGSA